ncbi:serine/threonine-protein kinase, partial [Aeromicrobium sp.]|uniref:protein kinase domain-containing protein n=1 Tax=Aeromicrobium sp. TaxID=1871063 RepID=UPI0019AA4E3B
CHQAGILHLDIKPANVLVTKDGGVKIVDFGIARAASDATATIAGTPHYMPPEQYEGRVDERSDIYSVGCLLFECLTGSPPFEGTMASQLLAHRDAPRPDPRVLAPKVSPGLAAVVMRAMAIDPDRRYASVHDMLAAMTAVDGGVVEPYASPPMLTQPVPKVVAAPGSPVVTRGTRFRTYGLGLLVSAFVVALLPGLVWTSAAFAPADYRPDVMSSAYTGTWWMLAVTIATAFLLLRRHAFFALIGGPSMGSPLPDRLMGKQVAAGVRMAAGAALRGALPMLFPWYVVLVAATSEAAGVSMPDELFSAWGVAWLLMPLAAITLALRTLTRLRPRPGAMIKSTIYLAGAALAALLFFVYPLALD